MKLPQFVCYFGFMLLTACGKDVTPIDKPNLSPLTVSEQTLTAAGGDFSFDLLRAVSANSAENLFLSPLSVQYALGMALNGASGATEQGIKNTINYNGLQKADINQGFLDLTALLTTMDNKVELDIANSVWYDNSATVNADFVTTIKTYYDGVVQGLRMSDGSAVNTINGWVDANTDHHIQHLIDNTDGAAMILINAIYFKGGWAQKFDKAQTSEQKFYSESGVPTSVPTMIASVDMTRFANSDLSGYTLPYGNGQFTMIILLPSGPSTVSSILKKVTVDSLNQWLSRADKGNKKIFLPKFKITSNIDLKGPLRQLGMGTAFSDTASFPYLFQNGRSYAITKAIQQAVVDVDEDGTTAAAATSITIGTTAVGPLEDIHIDHPFVFLISEKHSGMILFAGQVFHPSSD